MTPEEILDTLKSGASLKTQRTLDAIYETCSEIKESGTSDFSYSNIAYLGKSRGCPAAQSIQNKTGDKYKTLIQSFRECYQKNEIKNRGKKCDWIEDIEDPKIRLLAKIQSAEIHRLNSLLAQIIPPAHEIIIREGKFALDMERFTQLERSALEYIVSKQFLDEWKFTKGARGEISDESGRRIFPVATVEAIEKALNNL